MNSQLQECNLMVSVIEHPFSNPEGFLVSNPPEYSWYFRTVNSIDLNTITLKEDLFTEFETSYLLYNQSFTHQLL